MSTLAGQQRALARHIRNPALHPAQEGIEPRRLRIYEELVYNTVEGFVAGGFPVLRALLDDAPWHVLVRRFLATHRCQTPYFLRIAEEFLDFLAADGAPGLPPFAQELAHVARGRHGGKGPLPGRQVVGPQGPVLLLREGQQIHLQEVGAAEEHEGLDVDEPEPVVQRGGVVPPHTDEDRR